MAVWAPLASSLSESAARRQTWPLRAAPDEGAGRLLRPVGNKSAPARRPPALRPAARGGGGGLEEGEEEEEVESETGVGIGARVLAWGRLGEFAR